jgi:hypothetical protein
MRALNRTIALLSVALLWAGCGGDVKSKVMCSSDTDCIMGLMCDTDASVGAPPQCCAGVCVIPTLGCDQGYRYVTFDKGNAPYCGYGDCVAEPMCPPIPDMRAPPDLTQPPPDLTQPTPSDGGGTD